MARSLQSLPPELLFRIFSDSKLDLIDLARTSLACPSLAPVTRLAAESHVQRRIIGTVLGCVPEDVLCTLASNDAGQSGWLSLTSSEADLQPLSRKYWDSFGDRDVEAGIQDLLPLARLFATLAAQVYRVNDGFPDTLKGLLPCTDGPHQLLLLLHALLYSLIRCLARRSRHSAGKAREVNEYSELLNLPEDGVLESAELEDRMRQECTELKAALMLVDPLENHLLEGSAMHCRCRGRTHASWYLLCWHHLIVRYRRFLTPTDIDHVAFRTIYYAVPAFPANDVSPPTPATTPSSESTGSATNRFLPSSASPWSFSLPGFFPSTSATSLPGPHGPPLLNPDSLLFSLTPSPTAEQSKAWYGLSEFALPAGAARLWAGWIGYGWAEGGLHWHDKAQRKAENRLGKLTSEVCEGQDHGESSAVEQSSMLPVERVLLAHARWRARVLLLEKDTLLEGMKAFHQPASSQRRQQEPSPLSRQRKMLLSQQSAFDWHFLSRALQIQQWALRGWSNAGGPEAGGAGSLYDEGGRIPGQVARSSPFEIILAPPVSQKFTTGRWTDKMNGILSSSVGPITALFPPSARSDEQANAARMFREIEVAERWRRAWEAIEEPLRRCLRFGAGDEDMEASLDLSAASLEDKVADAWRRADAQQRRVLSALGDLYGGLHPRERGGQLRTSALCNETPELTNCTNVVGTNATSVGPEAPPSLAGPSTQMLRPHARVPHVLSPLVATIKATAIVALLAWLAQLIMTLMR